MKKIFTSGIFGILAAFTLTGCGATNMYKEMMAEWLDDFENQAVVLKDDNKCDILLGLIDKDSKVISSEVLEFTEGQYLYDILKANPDKYTLQGSESQYGFFLTGINDIVTDYSKDGSYISLWINGTYANSGVSSLELHDNDVVACIYMVGY
jgi:hypothetical protein